MINENAYTVHIFVSEGRRAHTAATKDVEDRNACLCDLIIIRYANTRNNTRVFVHVFVPAGRRWIPLYLKDIRPTKDLEDQNICLCDLIIRIRTCRAQVEATKDLEDQNATIEALKLQLLRGCAELNSRSVRYRVYGVRVRV